MSVSNLLNREHPHLVFLPSGIGSLTPFFRLAVMVASSNCKVTFINIQPQASSPELTQFSRFISNYQAIKLLDFEIHSQTPSKSTIRDPFIIHIENINSSLYQLNPILSSLQVSAIFSDFVIAATMAQIAEDLNIPLYIISTTSALFFSTVAYLPVLIDEDPCTFSNSSGKIEIPGLTPVPKSSIPPTWMHDSPSNYLLAAYLLPNARSLSKVKGFLLNTYEWFEPETMAALKNGRILNTVFPVGPLQSYEPQKSHDFPWLNEQPAESVVYVNFGSREVLSTDQIRELGEGLEICGYKYLWVLKNEEKHDGGEFQELLTDSFLEGTEKTGRIIKGLVNHERVLAHPAIGGFVNQCEWDSIMLAAWYGVPILTWPQHGDQKMNAETVEKAGLGILVNDWGWGGEKLVEGKEIGWRIKQIMGNVNIKKKAKIVREKAREACEIGGSSDKAFVKLLEKFCRRY
ncbi:hypothetical protein RD792_001427 [Penstemon davidsonii]|uniref:Uncharacterized protein n=1 Tax=Penstemon davidsonii TaxID=160366 RepID=A0ABR0DNC9_9LAMI|nr:hypothetical protein RD792_001427 [Penstemon davidsonii]